MERMWQYPLSLMHFVGVYTEKPTKRVFVATSFYAFVYIFVVTALAMQLVNVRNDIVAFVVNIEAISAYTQILFKSFAIGWNQKKLVAILKDAKQFWKSTICPDDMKLQLDTTTDMFTRILKLYFNAGVLAMAGFEIAAVATSTMPTGVWVLENQVLLYHLTFVCQVAFFPIALLVEAGYDCLFVALCFETTLQFRILCHFIKNVKYSTNSAPDNGSHTPDLKLCIQHHAFLLKFMGSLQDYCSTTLLTVYLTSSPMIFAEMYIGLERYSYQMTVVRGIAFCVVLFQFGLYCLAVELVADEAEAVAFSVYDSKWYSDFEPAQRRSTGIIMARAQKRIVFKAGGLMEMNVRALLQVLRVSWSIYNVSKALKG